MKDDNYEGIFIHFSDGKIYLWNYLEELLKNEKFKDIPKLVFLEACRGQMHELAPPENATMADANRHPNHVYPPPEITYALRRNVALFAASTEGNVALLPLDPEKPSYFTDAVCTALRDHPYQDLQELKRRVVADLSNTRPSVEVSQGEWRNVHMLPVLEDSLTREFKFLQ